MAESSRPAARADRRRQIVLLLLAIGALERVWWNLHEQVSSAGGEAFLVAFSLSQGRGFADAYGLGTGPTAHLMPVSPMIGGAVYGLLGYTQAAEAVLAAWSITVCLGSYYLLDRAFGRLGAPSGVRLAALAFLCLAPTYIAQEAVDFRVWEGGLAAFLSALMADRLFAGDGRAAKLVAPLLFFVHPLLGTPAFVALAGFWLSRGSWRTAARHMLVPLALLALLIAPWAIRNQIELGAPVLLRSNAGLELAIAQYPGAATAGDRAAAFEARLHQVHPLQGRQALAAMRAAGGEVAWSRALGHEASAWMAAHPGESARLMLTHIADALVPGEWIFRMWGNATLAPVQARLAQLVGVLGLIGLGAGLALGDRRWRYVALPILVPVLLFAPFQPAMRYTYLFYAPLAFCAACGLALLGKRLGARWFGPGTSASPQP